MATLVEGLRRYYTPQEVAEHDTAENCWVSFFGRVYDLTPLLDANKSVLAQPIVDHAGQDLTHWFDAVTQDVKVHVNPATELRVPYTPMGRFIHIPPPEPTTDWVVDFEKPWWKDDKYAVGSLTRKTRKIRVKNMLTRQDHLLEVCSEETMAEVLDRYTAFNSHASSYTWKYTDSKEVGRVLDMAKTLEESEIPDERGKFDHLSIDDEYYIPTVHLYFADDLTVA
ncbi:cytochrome b5 domain-containing protein 1-like protein [Pavlovales sp. CCMP2436]|nr:cytochrome b5 domain-containing protein 1-like protein [Pavlovales sp. CCMP2436]